MRNIIEVDNVSMKFNLSKEKVDSVKEYAIRKMRGTLHYQEFWSLRNISVTIRERESLGIIGLNGSGKSTLLKIIAGVMKPTSGSVRVLGTITPLIELGAGFDAELSARENIFLNGAILGHNREAMRKKFDEIMSFSELDEFIDVPVKNFSSGMVARLAFSIAIAHPADILIVDEVLSVGDYKFQKKCKDYIKSIVGAGSTVIFVSHSNASVCELCKKALWLDHGSIVTYGDVEEVCKQYAAAWEG